jgi:hypothetical protein
MVDIRYKFLLLGIGLVLIVIFLSLWYFYKNSAKWKRNDSILPLIFQTIFISLMAILFVLFRATFTTATE